MSVPASMDPNHHLPTPRTTLIGRQHEVEDVAALLLRPDIPMVTILGPGGAGKTRVALSVADELSTSFRDGVWFVPLEPIHDPDLLIPTIAQVLGIRDTGDLPVGPRLHDRLREAETLLVLDNAEQVRDAGPALADLLRTCPGVKLLVTSRAVLRLSVEHVYPIAGLPLPDEQQAATLEQIGQNDAVRLFVARAQAASTAFRLDPDNAQAVLDICRRLDGLPLAIELAAARTRILSPRALLAQITQRLTILSGGPRDQPRRHQTIRDTVDWSVQLMGAAEREVFRRLAVFSATFTATAAAAVATLDPNGDASGADDTMGDALITTYEILSSLIDQSLLHQVPDWPDEPRFRLLQTIREVALEQLEESGEADLVSRRHATSFLAIAEEAAPHLTGPEQARWLNTLERSLDDLRAAMAWFAAHGEREMQLRLAIALWRFGYTRGHLSEARQWLITALEHNPEPTPARVTALNAKGLLASTQGDTDSATTCHTEAKRLSETLGDRRGVAVALNGLGDAAAGSGDRELAQERYQAALAIFRELGDRRGTAGALTNLGNLAWDHRDLDAAIPLHEEALAIFQEIDERRGLAWSAGNLGTIAAQQGRLADARPYLRDAQALYEEVGDPAGVMLTLEGFAEIAHAEGHPELEAMLHSAASVISEEIGAPIAASVRPWYDANLARIRAELGPSFDRIWAEGQVMSPDDAIAAALDLGSSPARAAPWRPVADTGAAHGLSAREVEVVRLIAEGRTSKEIADELYISVRTVGTHITHIFSKLGVSTRSAVTAFAHREGLV